MLTRSCLPKILATFLEERPGAYILVGNGDTAMCHHPSYNFDDEAIPFGSSWYSGMIEARMTSLLALSD